MGRKPFRVLSILNDIITESISYINDKAPLSLKPQYLWSKTREEYPVFNVDVCVCVCVCVCAYVCVSVYEREKDVLYC